MPIAALRAPLPDPATDLADAVRARIDGLAKPPGSLAALETLAVRLAAAQARPTPVADRARVVVFAGDHGVAREESVSPYPPEVTASMVRTFAAGRAAVAVLARQAGAELEVVDVGVAGLSELPPGTDGVRVVGARVAEGTANLAAGPAMTPAQRDEALQAGAAAADRAAVDGVQVLAIGEMGIGNTTPATAIACRLLGRPAEELTGPGTGLDVSGVSHKARVIQRALDRTDVTGPLDVLAELGGFELVAMVGCMLQAAHHRIPVVLDGFIVGASALAAVRLDPGLRPYLVAATRSAEPGHAAILDAVDAGEPLLDLGLRLGEASGAALALPLLRSACAIVEGMATLDDVLSGRI